MASNLMKSFCNIISCCLILTIVLFISITLILNLFGTMLPPPEQRNTDIISQYSVVNCSRACYDKKFMFHLQKLQIERARLELAEAHGQTGFNDSFKWFPSYYDTDNMNLYNQNYGIFGFEAMGKRKNSNAMKRNTLLYYRIWKGGSVHILSILYKYALMKNAVYFPCQLVGKKIQQRLLNKTSFDFSKVHVKCKDMVPQLLRIGASSTEHFSFTFVRDPLSRFISAYTEIEDQLFSVRHDIHLSDRFLSSPIGSQQRFLEFVRLLIASNGSDVLFSDPYKTMLHIAPQIGILHYALEKEGRHIELFRVGEDFNDEWAKMANAAGFPGLSDLSNMSETFPHASSDDYYGTTLVARETFAAALASEKPNLTTDRACSNESNPSNESRFCSNIGSALHGTISYHYLRAICRVYLADWICTGYVLPAACADLIDEADELARDYVATPASGSDQQLQQDSHG